MAGRIAQSGGPAGAGRSQTDAVVEGVKALITAGELEPGARLPIEKELAASLGVSRGSLREGVRALVMMGVLETRQGDGTYVTSLDPELLTGPMRFMVDLQLPANAAHVQSVRRILEAETAARAAQRISAEELARAGAILDRVDELLGRDEPIDHEAALDADVEFHRVIGSACGNPFLEALVDAVSSRTVRARMWRAISERGVVHRTQAEHRAILRELEARDPDRARIQMSAHLLGVEEFIDDHAGEVPAQ